MKKMFAVFLTVVGIFLPLAANGDMLSPDSVYHIYADVVDTGGLLSDGGMYSLQDSLGEPIASSTSGGIYKILAGYQAMTSSSISLLLSQHNIDLGDLSMDAVSTASTVASVTTDDENGYTMSIANVDGEALSPVQDGTVNAGSEEYGFSAAGDDSLLVGDNPVMATVISSSSTPVTDSQTTLTFKASIGPHTAGHDYSQTITLQAVANLTL